VTFVSSLALIAHPREATARYARAARSLADDACRRRVRAWRGGRRCHRRGDPRSQRTTIGGGESSDVLAQFVAGHLVWVRRSAQSLARCTAAD